MRKVLKLGLLIIVGIMVVFLGNIMLNSQKKAENKYESKISNIENNIDFQNIEWNVDKKVSKIIGNVTFQAVLSKDKTLSWIYHIDVKKAFWENTLCIPETIDNAKVIYIGALQNNSNEKQEYEFLENVFGNYVEPFHGETGYLDDLRYIKQMVIPDTVLGIGAYAFSGMEYLKEVDLPYNLQCLDEFCFYGCKNLKKVMIHEKLTFLSTTAFENCVKLLDMDIKNYNYKNVNGFIIEQNTQTLITVLPLQKDGKIPDGVKIIQTYAFSNATMKEVTIPTSVMQIEKNSLTNKNICNVNLADGNPNFEKSDNNILTKEKSLLVVAEITSEGELVVSDKVLEINEEFSIVGDNAKTLIVGRNLRRTYGMGLPNLALDSIEKVYFCGDTPPMIYDYEKGNASLPIFVDVYVPQNSIELYENCYREIGMYGFVNNFYCY